LAQPSKSVRDVLLTYQRGRGGGEGGLNFSLSFSLHGSNVQALRAVLKSSLRIHQLKSAQVFEYGPEEMSVKPKLICLSVRDNNQFFKYKLKISRRKWNS